MEGFRAKFHISQGVALQYCPLDRIDFDRKEWEVVIPMITFIEGGMRLPMGRVTWDYLINHRLCPHQCAPNLFRVLGCVDALNKHISLRLTWHDVVNMYECHSLADSRYYLKSISPVVRLISCLPKSNKGVKDDFLIAFGAWHDGLHYPVQEREPGGYPRFRSLLFFSFSWSMGSCPSASCSSILFVFHSFPMVIILY